MDGWIQFWSIAYGLGLGVFALVTLLVVPLGARDLRRLLARRSADTPNDG